MLELQQPRIAPNIAEGMHVTMAQAVPIDEFDGQLERPLRCLQKRILVQPQRLIEQADLRNCRFADANGADLLGLHERDGKSVFKEMCTSRRNHPPCRATAGNDNADWVRLHYEQLTPGLWVRRCYLSPKATVAKYGRAFYAPPSHATRD